jgi:hypothetical protein
MAKHKKKKCPNCGRVTAVDDKQPECQWCHWPVFVKHPLEIEQRGFAPWRLSRKTVVIYILSTIILCALAALYYSGWELTDFVNLIMSQWHESLLTVLITFGVFILFHFVVWYVGTKIRPEFLVAALFIIGISLLVLTDKQSIYYEDISKWIGVRWDMNFFTAALTVFSLGFAIAGLILIDRKKK